VDFEFYPNKYVLYNSDCFDVLPHIDDKSINAIICDLPYGTTQNKWDSVLPLDELWKQYKRILKNNGVVVLFGAEPFSSLLRISNLNEYKYDWIWEKPQGTGFLNAKKRPLVSYETISVFYTNQCLYNPQFESGKPYVFNHNTESSSEQTYGKYITTKRESDGKRYPKSILKFNNKNPKNQGLHKTQKPIELMEYLIRTYTNETDTVLDNCMGSGTTGVACKLTNRKFIGIEKEPEYFNIAQKRISETQAGGLFFNSNTSTEL
jgi:site-specific DNA-methyltransferase (adenine-specific)